MTAAPPRYAPGALVHARGRDWVVLPGSDDPDLLMLRPLGGTDDDATGLYLPLEEDDVSSASLPLPDPAFVGDAVAASLLRDAVRLGFRSAAGPLRCLGRIAFEPRPYQLVPLLMALRQDPVRLLIGDDVGIGKTIEAGLIARELLDRGEIRRIAVLCPPHLCDQWQSELRDKFNVEAVVVRPGTVSAIEREIERERGGALLSRSLFEERRFVVVSIDYIKSDRRRPEFVRACPELVIVDEAHGVAESAGRSAQQQRHSLVAELARDPERHLVFATATPHSGDQQAFASLVGLLDPALEGAVANLEFAAGTAARERLASHFVQRRRADIRRYLEADTDFPDRMVKEDTYRLSVPYRQLLERILAYARDVVQSAEGQSAFHQRLSWWAALGLLRCASSSPAAAAAALRTRAPRLDGNGPAAADALAAPAVLDLEQSDEAAQDDSTPGADTIVADDPNATERSRLLALARDADALRGEADAKLAGTTDIVRALLRDGFSPIVFCRYIATAHYVAEALKERLRGAEVTAVTGELPPEEREERVVQLGNAERRVLVATDCLSEGVNLQHSFDAVVHYDLAWNPTRHEQREGRVDRYGQPKKEVRAVLVYGEDNRVDGVVLEVLLRKAENIRKTLGVSVPLPADTDKVLEAIFDQLFQRGATDFRQLELFASQQRAQLSEAWDRAAERERRTRTIFAQHAMRVEEVRRELDEARAAVGTGEDVRRFVDEAVRRLTSVRPKQALDGTALEIDTARLPLGVRGRFDSPDGRPLRVGFKGDLPPGFFQLSRTHPFVEALGTYLLDTSLDTPAEAVARRAGAVRTAAVAARTVLLLLRARYLVREASAGEAHELLAEEALLLGFNGPLDAPHWLPKEEVERLSLEAEPVANVASEQAAIWVREVRDALPGLRHDLDQFAQERASELLDAHRRVRAASRLRRIEQSVEPKLPMDLLGIYVLMPAPVRPLPPGGGGSGWGGTSPSGAS